MTHQQAREALEAIWQHCDMTEVAAQLDTIRAFIDAHPDAPADGVVAGLGEPVATLNVQWFRGDKGMTNVDVDYHGELEPGSYRVVTHSAALAFAAAEVARYRADAERYRWLRAAASAGDDIHNAVSKDTPDGRFYRRFDDLDAAIDAAIRSRSDEKGGVS